jgi:hypothetical protein
MKNKEIRHTESYTRHAELVSASFKRFRNLFGMTALLIFPLLFISCQAEVTLTVQKDDSVAITFEGASGPAFTRMISSAAGVNGAAAADSQDSGDFLIDEESVSYELAKAGFSDVKVLQKKGGAVRISMTDKAQSSYLFTSKIVKAEKGKLSASLSRKSLEDFYASADEQTRMILDLFLAPVFNDEEMTEAEYLEMVGAFYGESAEKEVGKSIAIINLISKDGSKETLVYPLSQIFCGLF